MFVVPSSGNFGRGFAHHTSHDEIDVLIVTDVLSPRESQESLRAYPHVQLKVIDQPDASGSHLDARMAWLSTFLATSPHAIVIDQYQDHRVPLAYEISLARELDDQTNGRVGAIFVPVGTGGLINGLLKYAVKWRRAWSIFAVDVQGSRLFWTPTGVKRHFSGIGNGKPTALISEVSDRPYKFHVVHVDDLHIAATCHRLRKKGHLLLGPSGGAVVAAMERVTRYHPDLIPDVGRVVGIIPDSGRSYMSTLYSDDWLIANDLGKVFGWHI